MIKEFVEYFISISCIISSCLFLNCSKINKEIPDRENGSVLASVDLEGTENDKKHTEIEGLKQFEIPFDNDNGVPFDYDEMYSGYIAEGFDVDDTGRIYFLGGSPFATIACFLDDRQVFRRKYKEFRSNDVHAYKDKLLVFDNTENRNDLFVLNMDNGTIMNSYKNIIENPINNYHFLDSSLVLRVFNYEENISIDTEMAYVEFDFEGKMNAIASNLYNLPDEVNDKKGGNRYLGKWNGFIVFFEDKLDDFREQFIVFYLYNGKGELVEEKAYYAHIFGDDIYGMEGFPEEHKKLKNNNVYMLGKKGNSALVSILPLNKMFQNRD